jgi:hypothetical protein
MSPDEPEVTELQLGTAKIDKPEAIDFILGQTQFAPQSWLRGRDAQSVRRDVGTRISDLCRRHRGAVQHRDGYMLLGTLMTEMQGVRPELAEPS